MRLIRHIPLSTSDFTSGRFDSLCKYVQENWKYNPGITFDESKDIVAVTFGYRDYATALESAFDQFPGDFLDDGGHLMWDPTSNLRKLIFGERSRDGDVVINAFDLVDKNNEAGSFFRSWPTQLISRWNYGVTTCNISAEVLSHLEAEFESYWCNNSVRQYNFQTLIGQTTSAATIAASMDGWISYETIANSTIKDIIDPEITESLFQEALRKTIKSILEQSWANIFQDFKGTGFSPADARELLQNEYGFPNLYSHMRWFLNNDILPKKALSLFTYERSKLGFYSDPWALNRTDLPAKDHYQLGDNYFLFQSFSDHCEPSSFRSYSWKGQIQSSSGDIIAYAKGSYISGPATKPSSGGELISAADSVGDQDADILDYILQQMQREIFDEYNEHVDKQNINMERLFYNGNLVTISVFERCLKSPPGVGIELVHECLNRLKNKYKRNFHIAAEINPLQYRRDSSMSSVVTDERVSDSIKILKSINKLRSHPNVLDVFLQIQEFKTGINTAFKYMQGKAE